jgi:hypothetical protein
MNKIKYRKRGSTWKYWLAETYTIQIPILPITPISSPFLHLDTNGNLTIHAGYAWDGPSGPAMDTPDAMRASLVHDVLYQLMRHGLLPQSARDSADRLLENLFLEDRLSQIELIYEDGFRKTCAIKLAQTRAAYFYWAVSKFAADAAKPDILEAP